MEKPLPAIAPSPSNEAMITPSRIVKLHPVQKCSGKTAAALCVQAKIGFLVYFFVTVWALWLRIQGERRWRVFNVAVVTHDLYHQGPSFGLDHIRHCILFVTWSFSRLTGQIIENNKKMPAGSKTAHRFLISRLLRFSFHSLMSHLTIRLECFSWWNSNLTWMWSSFDLDTTTGNCCKGLLRHKPEGRGVQRWMLTHTYQIVMSLLDAILLIPLLWVLAKD